jgi:aminoacylase
MITVLQEYLALKTVHPHADYAAVISLFKRQALADGFITREIMLPSGNPVLIITLEGSDSSLPALALNHHMDVVPADNAEQWDYPPFEGHLENDFIYGRGTQDCKGLGVVQYGALRELKKRHAQPVRTIHCIMVPDEERGGYCGAKEFIAHPEFASLNIGFVLDEGMPSGNEQELLLKIDERTPIQIRVTSVGPQGHASGIHHENGIHALVQFLACVTDFHDAQKELTQHEQPGTLISMHITSLAAHNSALNVIPTHASATIDMRIPSRITAAEGIAIIERLLACYPSLRYEILATSKERLRPLSIDALFYRTLATAVEKNGFTPRPFAFEATTDARFYSSCGIETIGFTPFTVTPNLHGTNEYIRVSDLRNGIAILNDFLHAFCVINNER